VVDVIRGDAAIGAIAARQHAVVTAAELAGAGLGERAIERRLEDGRLRRLHRGIYLAAPLPAPLTPEMAAVLACGPTAVLSHGSAAALWAIRPQTPATVDVIEVTVVGPRVRARPGIAVHRARRLDPRDRTRRHGIPVTGPARTLLDLAAGLPARELDRAVEQAQVLRLVTRGALLATLARASGHHGAPALRAAAHVNQAAAFTRSEAEAHLLELIRAADLPAPRTNVRIAGYEVDFLWPAERLVIEVDGFAYHATRQAFERDRLRDGKLQARGLRVMRVTWQQITGTPESLIARIAAALAAAEHVTGASAAAA
jgi:very-short-patch-repair endonuclease